MVAFALRSDGWYLRSDIIWHKPNPMPESVTDRPTKAHEYLFLLSKSERYFYDAEAIKEKSSTPPHAPGWANAVSMRNDRSPDNESNARIWGNENRNRRSVWTVPTQPYKESHFATFPEKLTEPCILAGSKPGDIVLDPFGGSGTVARVAVKYNRKAIHCDLGYHELAKDTRCANIQKMIFA
jgi:DNA modification methylase